MRRTRSYWLQRSIAALAIALLLALPPAGARAAEFRSGDTLTIGAGEQVTQDLYLTAQAISIEGTVDGDVFAAAQQVTVNGTINGSLNAAAQSVVVNGSVARAARIAAQSITVQGQVGRDLLAFGATVLTESRSRLGGDVLLGAGSATLAGNIGGRILGGAGQLTVGGSVERGIEVEVSDLTILSTARVGGPVTYRSEQTARIDSGAALSEQPQRLEPRTPTRPSAGEQVRSSIGGALAQYLMLLGVGTVAVWLFRQRLIQSAATLRQRPWLSLGLGVVAFIVPPVVILFGAVLLLAIFVAIFGVGGIGPVIPPTLIVLAVWLAALYLSQVVVGNWLGRWILDRMGGQNLASPLPPLAIGLAIPILLGFIPIVGPLVGLAVVVIGAGAIVTMLFVRQPIAPAPDVRVAA